MIVFANKNGMKISVKGSGERAECPLCKKEVISVFGEVYKHHWRHLVDNPECTGRAADSWKRDQEEGFYATDPEWHDNMKLTIEKICLMRNLDFEVEKTYKKNGQVHRTDACINGINIEFQRSNISPEEIKEREDFYGEMIWVLHEDLFSKKKNFCSKPFYYYKDGRLFNYTDEEIKKPLSYTSDEICLEALNNKELYAILVHNEKDKQGFEEALDRLRFASIGNGELLKVVDGLNNYKKDEKLALLLWEKIEAERLLEGVKSELNQVENFEKKVYYDEKNKQLLKIEDKYNYKINVMKENELLPRLNEWSILLEKAKKDLSIDVGQSRLRGEIIIIEKTIYQLNNNKKEALSELEEQQYIESQKITDLRNKVMVEQQKVINLKIKIKELTGGNNTETY